MNNLNEQIHRLKGQWPIITEAADENVWLVDLKNTLPNAAMLSPHILRAFTFQSLFSINRSVIKN